MKRTTALYAVTAIAALSFATQVFAKSGNMGGSRSQGSGGNTHHTVPATPPVTGNGMQPHTSMNGGSPNGTTNGSGHQGMNQGATGSGSANPNGQMPGSGTGGTNMHPPVTTGTN